MKKILVVRYGTIGDSIFASAFYRELRKNLPQAQIDILSDKISTGVMKFCPYINEIIDIDTNKKFSNIKNYIEIFKKYDTVYFLKNDSFFTLVAFLAGVKNRVGFDISRNKFLTLKSPYKEDRHEVDCYLDLLKITGLSVENDKTEVWIDAESEQKVKQYIQTNKKKVLIQAYSRFEQKNWLDLYWVNIIKYLSDKFDMQLYYSGGVKDVEAYNVLTSGLGNIKNPPINMCGKFSILESMALVKNMDLVIGIDSCTVHMAAALEVPTILLHGATSLKRWRPRSDKCIVLSKFFECSPCCLQSGRKKYCKHTTSRCMKALCATQVEKVLDKLFTETETNNPKVSVIVPVYNVEKYLARCLESIINQTMDDIEIICVNDGSSDESLSILEEFAKTDARIKIINQENKGLSNARNVGINTAKGEYISFVDSDDWIALDFIEKLYNSAKSNDADISVCSVLRCKKQKKNFILRYNKHIVAIDYNDKLQLADVPSHCYVWNKLYKTSLLKDNSIFFEDGKLYEDVLFTPAALYYANKLVAVTDTNYYYFRHKNTIVKLNSKKSKQDFEYSSEKLKIFLKNKGINLSKLETKIDRFKILGLTVFKILKKQEKRRYVLFNLFKWGNEIC